MPKRWEKPRVKIEGYKGPYRRDMLEDARAALLHHIDSKDTVLWARIRMKTGILSNGERNMSYDGWGQASCDFSHTDLPVDSASTPSSSSYHSHYATVSPQSSEEGEITNNTDCITLEDDEEPDFATVDSSETTKSKNSLGKGESTRSNLDDLGDSAGIDDEVITIDGVEDKEEIDNESVIIADEEELDSNEEDTAKEKTTDRNCMVTVQMKERGSVSDFVKKNVEDMNSVDLIEEGNIDSVGSNGMKICESEPEVCTINTEQAKPDETEASVQNVVLKCDFCEQTCRDPEKMVVHLKQSIHYSASSFNCDKDNKPIQLHEKLALSNKFALYKSVLAICPSKGCTQVFSSIYECALHYHLQHFSKSQSTYALTKVTKEIGIDFCENDLRCPKCNCSLSSSFQLHKHMKQNNHYPFDKGEDGNYLFFCKICQKFKRNFGSAIKHRPFAHKTNMSDGVRRLAVVYIGSKVVHRLPGDSLSKETNNKRKAEHQDNQFSKKTKVETVSCPGGKSPDPGYQMESNSGFELSKLTVADTGRSDPSCEMHTIDQPIHKKDYEEMKKWSSTSDLDTDDAVRQSPLRDSGLTEGYKCDYCDLSSDAKEVLLIHMKKECHNSASLVWMDSSQTPLYVKKPEFLQNDTGKKAFIAICPVSNCNQTFRSTSVCSEHYTECHDQDAEPAYAVISVLHEETVVFQFNNGKFVLDKSLPKEVMKKGKAFYKCFLCCVCDVSLPSFGSMCHHLKRNHFSRKSQGRAMMPVTMLRLGNDRFKHSTLPFQNNKQGEYDSLLLTIDNLNIIQMQANEKVGKKLKKKIKELKKLVKGFEYYSQGRLSAYKTSHKL